VPVKELQSQLAALQSSKKALLAAGLEDQAKQLDPKIADVLSALDCGQPLPMRLQHAMQKVDKLRDKVRRNEVYVSKAQSQLASARSSLDEAERYLHQLRHEASLAFGDSPAPAAFDPAKAAAMEPIFGEMASMLQQLVLRAQPGQPLAVHGSDLQRIENVLQQATVVATGSLTPVPKPSAEPVVVGQVFHLDSEDEDDDEELVPVELDPYETAPEEQSLASAAAPSSRGKWTTRPAPKQLTLMSRSLSKPMTVAAIKKPDKLTKDPLRRHTGKGPLRAAVRAQSD